jgi:hypothetical protein
MDRSLLNRNIARLRRDVRPQSCEIEQLIAADLDRTPAAQRLMRAGRSHSLCRKAGAVDGASWT